MDMGAPLEFELKKILLWIILILIQKGEVLILFEDEENKDRQNDSCNNKFNHAKLFESHKFEDEDNKEDATLGNKETCLICQDNFHLFMSSPIIFLILEGHLKISTCQSNL